MQEKKDPQKRSKQQLNSYVKYSGIAFQMMAIIGIFIFAGYKIDQYYAHDKLWVTAIFSLLGVAIALYQVIKQLKP